jgi:uncharacterized protein YeaO (DUF488 family)
LNADDNVDYLPIWKKDATPAERLEELSLMARKNPERFQRFALVFVEKLDDAGRVHVRSFEHGCNVPEVIGLYELAKLHYFNESKR